MFHLLASLAEAAKDETDLPRNDERLYVRTYALSSFMCYRETLAHGSTVWQPVLHVLPCEGSSAVASECSSMLLSNSSVASDSLPPA